MRLPNRPLVCSNEPVLQIIIAAAGRFIWMDDPMSLLAMDHSRGLGRW